MQRSRTLRWVAAVLVPVTILLSGCDPFDEGEGGGGKPTVPTKQASIGKQAGCGQPGQKVKQWLPAFDRSNAREATIGSLQNPCPPFADLAGLINDAIA